MEHIFVRVTQALQETGNPAQVCIITFLLKSLVLGPKNGYVYGWKWANKTYIRHNAHFLVSKNVFVKGAYKGNTQE